MKEIIYDKWVEIKGFVIGFLIANNIDIDLAFYLSLLMVADTCFGLFKYALVDELKFSIKNLFKGILVKIIMLTIPIVFVLTANGLKLDFAIIIDLFMKAMLVGEVISIINNFNSIRMNKEVKSDDFLSTILNRIANFLKNKIQSIANAVLGKEND